MLASDSWLLTWDIKQLRGLEHAGLVLVNFAEVLVKLL